jgi:hypothetical protein
MANDIAKQRVGKRGKNITTLRSSQAVEWTEMATF